MHNYLTTYPKLDKPYYYDYNEFRMQSWDRVRTLCQYEVPNPTQPTNGREKKRKL